MFVISLLAAQATPASHVLGLESWRSLDGHPLFEPNLIPDGFPPLTLLGPDGCPITTDLDVCDDDRFWQTTCGAKALERANTTAACRVRFDAYAAGYDAGTDGVVITDPRTGIPTTVHFEPYEPRRITWEGFDSRYAKHLLTLSQPRTASEALGTGLVLDWWDSNCSVQSCEELTHEAFDDYSTFELGAAEAIGRGDFRAVFDAAYSSDGIARKPLYAASGEGLSPFSPTRTRSTYLPGYLHNGESGRGAVYGFTLDEAPRQGISALLPTGSPIEDTVSIPLLARALGLYATDLPGEAAADDAVFAEFLRDFDDACDIDTTSGLVTCATADATIEAIADAFNPGLWDFTASPVSSIPDDQRWPAAGENPWDTHQTLAAALSGTPDDTLVWLEDRMAEFRNLERRRSAAWERLNGLAYIDSLQRLGTTCNDLPLACADVPTESAAVLAGLRTTDQRIAALLAVFDDAGCLGPTPTACDWSPRWFARAVVGQYTEEREELYQTCITRTGNDFRALRTDPDETEHWLEVEQTALGSFGPICTPSNERDVDERCQVQGDYLADDATVRSYFSTLDAWGEAFAERWNFPVDPETGRPTIGGTSSDRSSIGDTNFRVELAYDAGWNLQSIDPLPDTLALSAHGQLQVHTRLFGLAVPTPYGGTETEIDDSGVFDPTFLERRQTGNLAFIDLYASNADGGDGWAVFDLLGTEVYRNVGGSSDNSEGPLSFHFVAQPSTGAAPGQPDFETSVDFFNQESTVFVGPVPLNLEVGAAGTVGLTANLQLDAVGGEDSALVTANSIFRPSARANVYASASAGIPGFVEAGIEADLTLVEVGLPVTTNLRAEFDTVSSLEVDLTAELETTLLAGRVRGFVDTPFRDYSTTLFRYDGIRLDSTLAETSFDADLVAIQRAFGVVSGPAPAETRDGPLSTLLYEDRAGTCTPPVRLTDPDVYLDFDDENLIANVLEADIGPSSVPLGTSAASQAGQHGQAIAWTGGQSLSPTTALPMTGDHTLSFWYRDALPGPLMTVGSTTTIDVHVLTDGRVSFDLPCTGGSQTHTLEPLGEETWHHVFVRRAGTTVSLGLDRDERGVLCDLTLDAGVTFGQATLDELGIWGDALAPGSRALLRTQGWARLPLSGSGSAPLMGVTDLQGVLVDDTPLRRVDLSWTNPPTLDEAGVGYDEVVVRVDTAGPVTSINGGLAGAVATDGTTSISVPASSDVVYVSTWARGPAGERSGPTAVVQLPTSDVPGVTGLAAQALDEGVRLVWALPADPVVTRVHVAHADGPLVAPTDGAVLYSGRAESAVHEGLPNDVPVSYTVWTSDIDGRLSLPQTLTVTPTSGASVDTLPPGSLTALQATAGPNGVALRWELPTDADPLQTLVRRIDFGVFRRTLGTVDDPATLDPDVVNGGVYAYELAAVDPSGNLGAVSMVEVTVDEVPAVVLFTATVVENEVELEAVLPPIPDARFTVVRTDGAPADHPFDGTAICSESVGACIDSAPPVETDLRYTAFVTVNDSYSEGVASELVRVQSSVGEAGPDRSVYVGERVDLVGVGLDAPGRWTGVPDIVTDGTGTWFVPRIEGTPTLTVEGTASGASVTDSFNLTVESWNTTVDAVTANPFAGDLLANEGVRGLWARELDVVVWTADGDLLAQDDTSLTLLAEDCSEVLAVDDDLALCRDGAVLTGLDLTTGTAAWTTSSPIGRWVGDLAAGVLAVVVDSTPGAVDVQLSAVDASTHVDLGTVTLTGPTGFPSDLALDDDGGRLAIASFNRVTAYELDSFSGSLVELDAVGVTDFGTVGIDWANDQLAIAVESSGSTNRLRVFDTTTTPFPFDFDVEAPDGIRGVQAQDGWLVIGQFEGQLLDTSGVEEGRYTASSWEPGPMAVREDEVWVAAQPGAGIGGDRVFVHPRTAPRLSTPPARVFNPFDAGFSVIEAMGTGHGHWAAKSFDQLVVGDASGVTWQTSVGFGTAPFDLTSMLCFDDTDIYYVADVAGIPSLVSAPVQSASVQPSGDWPLPSDCTSGFCSEEGPVLLCDDDIRLYDLDGTLVDTANVPPEVAFPTVTAAGDGLLLSSFGPGGETVVGVWPEDGSLTVHPSLVLPTSGNGALIGDELFLPGAMSQAIDLPTAAPRSIPWFDITEFDGDRATGTLVAQTQDVLLGGDAGGLVSGVVTPPAFAMASEDGLTLFDSGDGLYLTSMAPLSVSSAHHAVAPGSDLATVVSWRGHPSLGLAMQCRATTGPCTVLSFNPFTESAVIGWTAGSVPGEHSLTVFAGTHRGFTSGVDRILVETP